MEVIFQSGILFAEMYHLMQAHRERLLSLKCDHVYKVLTGHDISDNFQAEYKCEI